MDISTKGLKKISSDQHSTTLQHPHGHHIVIAHSKLNAEHAKHLREMPMVQKFNEGGGVKPWGSDTTQYASSELPQVNDAELAMSNINAEPAPGMSMASAPEGPGAPNEPLQMGGGAMRQEQVQSTANRADLKSQEAAQVPEAKPSYGNLDLGQQPQQQPGQLAKPPTGAEGAEAAIRATKSNATLEGQRQEAIAPNLAKMQDYSAQILADAPSRAEHYTTEFATIRQAVQDGKINPNAYMESLSPGGKAMTAIGLILGGIGGGMTHQGNPALEFLNKQIDRDIEGQKSDLGRKVTLFSMLKDEMGNEKMAHEMTRAAMQQNIIDTTNAMAAKSGSQIAKNNAIITTQPLQAQVDAIKQRAAIFKSAQQMLGSPSIDPNQHYAAARVYMEAQGAPPAAITKAATELEEIHGLQSLQSNMQHSFDKINSQFGGGVFTPGAKAAMTQVYSQQLQMIMDHRFNDEAAHQDAVNLFKGLGDMSGTVKVKQDVMNRTFDTLMQKQGGTLKQYSVPLPQMAPRGKPAQK